MRSISGVVSSAFLYVWYFVNILFHFRPYQLMGLRRKLILICGLFYCLETLYHIVLQALKIPYSKFSTLLKILLNTMFFISLCCQVSLLTNHFRMRRTRRQQVAFFLQMILPGCFCFILAMMSVSFIYPTYNQQHKEGKLLIGTLVPLIGVALSRISVQRLWNITHPGYS